jgi:hypothetical protein
MPTRAILKFPDAQHPEPAARFGSGAAELFAAPHSNRFFRQDYQVDSVDWKFKSKMPIVIALHSVAFFAFGRDPPRGSDEGDTTAIFSAERIQIDASKAPMPER